MKTVLMALVSISIYGVAIFSGISAQAPAQADQGSLIKVADDKRPVKKAVKKAAKKDDGSGEKHVPKKEVKKSAKKAAKKAKKDED